MTRRHVARLLAGLALGAELAVLVASLIVANDRMDAGGIDWTIAYVLLVEIPLIAAIVVTAHLWLDL